MFVFGPKDSYKLFETDSLLDNQSASTQTTDNRSFLIDEKHFTIDICSNFNESNQVNYESIRRFQTDRLTLFLFIIEGNTDGKIDPESIITFKILSDIYLFDTKSYLFIVNGSYPIQDQNTMKSNIELLLDLEDIQVSFINSKSLDYFEVLIQTLRKCKPSIPSKQKEFSWTYPKIKELKDQLEQKPNCLSEIYYLHSLLKEANVKTEDNDGLLVFSYRNIQYFYDYKKNKLSCSNNQGIKLLDKKGFAVKFAKSQYEGPIETLKKEKEALEKEKLEKIREKRTQDIFKDVGGSDRTVRHNNKYYRPHEECTEFPKNNYTCQYIEAVQEAVHFVSEKLEIEKSIDIEATKLELLKKLSEERYDHSVGAIVDEKANGKHVKDLKRVVDKIISRREVLEREATDIATDEIIEISNGNLQTFRQERLNNLSIIVNTKEAIKLIESTMKQKQDLIHLLEEKKSLADARVRFSEG
ncbi:unnamed protein product [Rotaria sp. Silwood2]|nr:unnamed protein product [Rotaria sp. Silwood2]